MEFECQIIGWFVLTSNTSSRYTNTQYVNVTLTNKVPEKKFASHEVMGVVYIGLIDMSLNNR